MEKDMAIKVLHGFAQAYLTFDGGRGERFQMTNPEALKNLRAAVEATKPNKFAHWDEVLDQMIPQGDGTHSNTWETAHEAFAQFMGGLFPEWETGSYEVDVEFYHYVCNYFGLLTM